jgi:serine/threonine protein kinase
MSCPSSLTTYCGSEWYIALEMRRQLDDDDADPYTPAVDVWTLGVVLHYMLFGWHPACARAHHTGLSTSTERTYSVFLVGLVFFLFFFVFFLFSMKKEVITISHRLSRVQPSLNLSPTLPRCFRIWTSIKRRCIQSSLRDGG